MKHFYFLTFLTLLIGLSFFESYSQVPNFSIPNQIISEKLTDSKAIPEEDTPGMTRGIYNSPFFTLTTLNLENFVTPVVKANDITVQLGADGTVTIVPADILDNTSDTSWMDTVSLDRDRFTCEDVETEFEGYTFEGYSSYDKEDSGATATKLIKMSDGNILAVYRSNTANRHVGNDGYLAGRISADNGETFGNEFEIFSDQYDDRNVIGGSMPNGDVVLVFRRYDAEGGVNIDTGYIISSDYGQTWGDYNLIESGAVATQPFGEFINRNGTVNFLMDYYESDGSITVRLYSNSDNFETVPTFTPIILDSPYVEHILIDIGQGKSIILGRNDSGEAGAKSFGQYNSTDGFNFIFKGETNIYGDVNRSIRCPLAAHFDSERNEIVIAVGDRGRGDYVEIDPEDLELRFYIQDADAVFNDQTAYELKHRLPRPTPNSRGFYGYPSLLPISTGLLGCVTERITYDNTLPPSSTNEHTSLHFFQLIKTSSINNYVNVTITVTDVEGNETKATAKVAVEDNIAPVVITKDISISLNANGLAFIEADDIDDGSSDACGISGMTLDNTIFDCSNIGTNTVILTVVDNNGNQASAEARVVVEDNIAPVVITKDITVELNEKGKVTISPEDVYEDVLDNCGIAFMTLDVTSFTCEEVGNNFVLLSVTDFGGNIGTAEAIIEVTNNFEDNDADGLLNNCDEDDDNDGIFDEEDNSPLEFNPDQTDTDGDGEGDASDIDDDNDGVLDKEDNCPLGYNPKQRDINNDGIGDVCDTVQILVSEAVTPNGDGINDTWRIVNIENHPNSLVIIYNRWGSEVFRSTTYKNDWNGRYKGDLLPEGSYYYQIYLEGNSPKYQDGWLYLTK